MYWGFTNTMIWITRFLFLRTVKHVRRLWIFICQLRDLRLLTTFVECPPIYISSQTSLVYVYIITRLSFVNESSTDYTVLQPLVLIILYNNKSLKNIFLKNVLILDLWSVQARETISQNIDFFYFRSIFVLLYQTLLLWMRKYLILRNKRSVLRRQTGTNKSKYKKVGVLPIRIV